MNLLFKKTNLAEAVNDEHASVRSTGPELMEYQRVDYRVAVEVFFRDGAATAYEPTLPQPYPAGMSEDDVRQEIHVGVEVNAECPVQWRSR